MAKSEDIIILVVVAVVGYFVYQAFFAPKTGILEQAGAAGKWTAENIVNPATTPLLAQAAAARGLLEGSTLVYVPATPQGYNVSNWTWLLKDGTHLGLPAGMTPKEFCVRSPDSPICAQIMAGG